jgi:hypothetical protein
MMNLKISIKGQVIGIALNSAPTQMKKLLKNNMITALIKLEEEKAK